MSFEDRVLSLLTAASQLGSIALRHFMRSQLPGSSVAVCASPYTDARLFTCHHGETAGVLDGRWHTLTDPDQSPVLRCSHGGAKAFELDVKGLVADVAAATPAARQVQCRLVHRVHPYLPLVITCCPVANAALVHYRREGA